MKKLIVPAVCLVLGACTALDTDSGLNRQSSPSAQGPSDIVRPQARPETMAPETDVSETRSVPSGPSETIVSLGNAAEPGLWLKTPLVNSERSGRVSYGATGQTVTVTLIPIDGPVTAGSRISLQAMQALRIPLTKLARVQVTPS